MRFRKPRPPPKILNRAAWRPRAAGNFQSISCTFFVIFRPKMAEFLKLCFERHHTTCRVAFILFFHRLVDSVEKLRARGRQAARPRDFESQAAATAAAVEFLRFRKPRPRPIFIDQLFNIGDIINTYINIAKNGTKKFRQKLYCL